MNTPKICSILCVNVDEQFTIDGVDGAIFKILEDGTFDVVPKYAPGATKAILLALENPSVVKRVKKITKDEAKIAQILLEHGARYIARGDKHLRWYANEPFRREDSGKWDMGGIWPHSSGKLPISMFPSIVEQEKLDLTRWILDESAYE